MSTQPSPTPSPVDGPRRDEGSVLTMILALMVVGSLAVLSLLTFATTLFTNRPPIEVRDRTFWSAKSAMSMAMTLQREFGPDGCYQATDSFTLNGFTANVTCTPTGNYFGTGRGRFAVITTSNDATTPLIAGRGVGAAVKPISGDVFLNAGSFGAPTTDLGVSSLGVGVTANVALSNYESPFTAPAQPATPLARYNDPAALPPVPPATATAPTDCFNPAVIADLAFPNPGVDWAPICQIAPWWELAGDLNTSGTYDYPELPPLPAYERFSVPQATISACNVYFPGRYDDPLTLGAGDHFFPSGVYYFEDTVTLQPGARVVAGEGRWGGCTFDAEAAFAPTAPSFHAITGKGATFLLGADASIQATDASLRINRRVSDSTSRGTETIAIRSVNFATSAPTTPSPVEIPDDVVYVADVYDSANPSCDAALSTTLCLERAADHQVRLTSSAPIGTYTPSTLTPTDAIVSFTQTGGSSGTNQFVTDGYVFVPNARVVLSGGTNDNYRLRLTAGVVASSLSLDYENMPSNASNWFLGVLDEPIQRQVELFVNVTAPNGQRTESRAIMEVNVDESYAINGWTVDPNAQTPPPPPPPPPTTAPPTTAPPTTAPPTTAPPTTAPPTTAPPTTAPPTTAPPTTAPPAPTPDAPCNVNRGGWTRDFGTPWTAEFWNRSSFTSPPSDPFVGTPTWTTTVSEVNKPNDRNGPGGGIQDDHYTARFTTTFVAGSACTVDLRRGSDDGMRIRVNGNLVLDDWGTYAYKESDVEVPVVAGANTIVVEYFERGGESGYEVRWRTDD